MRIHLMITLGIMLAALLGAIGCKGSGGPSPVFQPMEFTVDSSLIGPPATFAGVSFRAPAGWIQADGQIILQMQQAAGLDTSGQLFRPETAYVDLNSGSLMMVTTFPSGEAQQGDFSAWARRVVETMRKQQPGAKDDWMLINEFPAVQIYSADSNRVQFRYLLDSKPPVSLDFVVRRAAWQSLVRTVESTLGTLQKN